MTDSQRVERHEGGQVLPITVLLSGAVGKEKKKSAASATHPYSVTEAPVRCWDLNTCWWVSQVVRSATVHPLQWSKQAKVTSGRPGAYILWLPGCRAWQWEQRVVDAESKEGISSSYFVCV